MKILYLQLLPKWKVQLTFTVLLLLFNTLHLFAQDSLATIYFYRQARLAGHLINYDVLHDSSLVHRMTIGSVYVYRSRPGRQTFVAKTEGRTSVTLDLAAGKTYYVKCGISPGVIVGRPAMYHVSGATAKSDILNINLAMGQKIIADENIIYDKSDTLRAVGNLYQRKHRNGTIRGVIFTAFAFASLINIASPPSTTIAVGNGQTFDESNGTGPYVVALVVTGVIATTGFVQSNNHDGAHLDAVLADYDKTQHFPATIIKKLKKKDFR